MKDLLYFTLNYNKDYLKLAQLCLDSLNKVGYTGDILFISDCKDIINLKYNGNILFMEVDPSNKEFSSINKLTIFNYKDAGLYDRFIFSDLDVLFLKNPRDLFELITDKVLYIREDDYSNMPMNTEYEYFGRHLMSPEELITSSEEVGLNAGFFMFNKEFLPYLKEVYDWILSDTSKINGVCEQPFINLFLFRGSLYNKTVLHNLITHRGYMETTYSGYVIHFPGGVGNFERKYEKMNEFIKLNNGIKNKRRAIS